MAASFLSQCSTSVMRGCVCALLAFQPPSAAALQESEMNPSIKMEVGIEDCLHIEFEYNKTRSVRAIPTFAKHIL